MAPVTIVVVGVAEPREVRRARLAAEHGIPAWDAAAYWEDLAARPRFAAERARRDGTVETLSPALTG